MITVRKASNRGRGDYGWLNTRYSFSFANYYDPRHMGVSSLRVINDDVIAPGAGFDTHGHRDMEIITYVTSGTIAHKDSMGNVTELPAGEFQLMSAGSGIRHSEYNASETEGLTLLQIWIEPNKFGGQPGYQQKAFGRRQGLHAVITPDGSDDTLKIKQDARLLHLLLEPQSEDTLQLPADRVVYVQLLSGLLMVNDEPLSPGDGARLDNVTNIRFSSGNKQAVEALVFDLPA
ncbi:pirin family protein [Motilimonas cestriensis]|uniref:Pirin family protein n=1 Tax=Motilimonas cestriensis TaxID=2742685 RepID=A0ABS8WBF8_9GAMM|nr:pirin family protein [Motilimonas cestriensis]MCE2594926.1 pirin family protein [Motilimonas cestriensis]